MDFSFPELPEDLGSTLTYTIEAFSFLVLRNERIRLSEFARRISLVTTPCKRTLLGIHSLLALEGSIERQYAGIALHGVCLKIKPDDFPIFVGWSKWTEDRIRSWLRDCQSRLDAVGITYAMEVM